MGSEVGLTVGFLGGSCVGCFGFNLEFSERTKVGNDDGIAVLDGRGVGFLVNIDGLNERSAEGLDVGNLVGLDIFICITISKK